MSGIGRYGRLAACLGMALALAGCQSLYRNHGWAPSDADLAGITVGEDTRETVAQAVGAPGTAGLLEDSGWYYVQSRYEHYGWREPREIDRQVVAITFDDGGVVQNIERFGLDDGQVVTLSRRVTDSNTRGVGFLRQLFGNFGRVNAGSILGAAPR
jgi:outer membrane protein assembly factor BamE (lipoprotein component of BamABCDE complex)